MVAGAYEDISKRLGGRSQKCILTTIHIKDVPFGEIDPLFTHEYSHELDHQWKVYAGNQLHLLTWNECFEQPLITEGWTQLRRHLRLQFQHHEIFDKSIGDYITSFHNYLVLEGPVAEPHLAEIIQTPVRNGVRKLEYQAWFNFCYDNYLSAGDILKFRFIDIEQSNRVDVDVDRVVN
ncbi:hypothetical protein A2U01_0000156 [Trifolium medium]|uniref:Uncharacterized protein n=1 Tax=Trifolium medium TaxID=97028 RepID=A0A392LWR4_9FABA|nr:hypothetical protein [Trifolium medium]